MKTKKTLQSQLHRGIFISSNGAAIERIYSCLSSNFENRIQLQAGFLSIVVETKCFHVKRKGSKMVNVHDFCNTCANGTTIKLSYYDFDSRDFMFDVVFNDAKNGRAALGFTFDYANIESIYVSADVVCCRCHVFNA